MTFPNLKNKHAWDALVTPEEDIKYAKRRGRIPRIKMPKAIIFCFSSSLLKSIIKNHKVKKLNFGNSELYLLKETKNRVGVLSKFGFGGPSTILRMEELIACGVKKFVLVGHAGSLQKHLKIGDVIVCDRAIRDEGTSHHYFKSGKYAYASKLLTKDIENHLQKLGIKYALGTTWTVDAPYRETVAEVKQYQKEGVSTVDMEAASVFAVAKYRGIEAGAIFTISDYLGELEWKLKFHLTRQYLNMIFNIAKEVLSKN